MDTKKREVAHFPLELSREILSRQPVKSLLRFKCVSKAWHDEITSQDFVRLHLSRSLEANSGGSFIFYSSLDSLYSFNFYNLNHPATKLPNPLKIDSNQYNRPHELIGSCNGLLCFGLMNCFRFALYNPATGAYKQLPLPERSCIKKYNRISVVGEFAYDCMADDFKVFSCASYKDRMLIGTAKVGEQTHLYSLKANSWEIIQNPPWELSIIRSRSVVTNNVLHWISCNNDKVIWCFDLTTRGYQEMPLPPRKGDRYISARLTVLRGCLHAVLISRGSVDIWMMKEHGVVESWTELVHGLRTPSVDPSPLKYLWCLLYAYSRDGRKILVGTEKRPRDFSCYDLDCQAATKFVIPGLPTGPSERFVAEPWVESLVPLL